MDIAAFMSFSVVYSVATLIILALGLAVIFGMMRVINLAQGEFMMLGAYTVILGVKNGLGLWVSIALAPVIVGFIGLIIERTIIQHLYGRILDTMLATWGISLIIVGSVTVILGPTTGGVSTPLGSFQFGQYSVPTYKVVVIAAAPTLLLLTYALFRYTRFGLIARATMQGPRMVAATGVNSSLVYMGTFALGAALSGLAGAIMAPLTGVVPTLGVAFIGKIFITVIVGGPLMFAGTVSASTVLGLVESTMSIAYTPIIGQVAMLVVAMVVIRVLPEGISGLWMRRS